MHHHREQSDHINTVSGEKKKQILDSQVVGAKENLKMSHGGPSQRQAPGTKPPRKVLRLGRD